MTEQADREARKLDRRRYQEELPPDNAKVWKLLETYSGIPPGEVEPHLRSTREKAWKIFPYGCIGRWRFLDLYITTLPEYPTVLQRLKAGETLLDAGCCFGYVLRQLALDGAPAANLIGSDLRQDFIDLGYDLFRDRDTFGGRFVVGDMLNDDPSLKVIDGKVDMIHAASFFHLFGWDDQVRLGERVVRFFKPDARDAMVFGRQVGDTTPVDHREPHDRYRHNEATLQEMWDEIGRRTGTKWKAAATLHQEQIDPLEKRTFMIFSVHKIA